MLFHTLYAPDAGLYCVQLSFLIEGDLVPAALREAWQQVLARHPILRTAFLWEGLEQPLQVVHQQLDLPWREEDWSALDPDEQNRRWDECLDADRRRGLHRSARPRLLRLALIRISPRAYRFLWNHHHLLLDGWSSSLVYKDVQVAYDACRRGAAGLPQAPRPYRDYLAWLPQQDLAQAEVFWREVLRGYRTPMRLPLNDIPDGRPVAVDGDGSHKLSLPADATVALQDFARRQQVSLNVVVQAAWALMLSRYSGDDDVVFGITLSGRPPALAGIESMVGLFINTLPMRVQATPDATVAAWLKHIQARQGDLQQYEHTSLLQVQSWSEMPAATPLFESLFVFENSSDLQRRRRGACPSGAARYPCPRQDKLSAVGGGASRAATPAGAPLRRRADRSGTGRAHVAALGEPVARNDRRSTAAAGAGDDAERRRATARRDRMERHRAAISARCVHPGPVRSAIATHSGCASRCLAHAAAELCRA